MAMSNYGNKFMKEQFFGFEQELVFTPVCLASKNVQDTEKSLCWSNDPITVLGNLKGCRHWEILGNCKSSELYVERIQTKSHYLLGLDEFILLINSKNWWYVRIKLIVLSW